MRLIDDSCDIYRVFGTIRSLRQDAWALWTCNFYRRARGAV